MNLSKMRDSISQWFGRIFWGRNGVDQLCLFLLGLSLVFTFSAVLFSLPWLHLGYYVCLFLFVYRSFSKNIYKRQAENQWFLGRFGKVQSWFRLRQRMFRERRTHKYFRCKNCRQMLRVPKGKGKLDVTCTKCGTHTIKKT